MKSGLIYFVGIGGIGMSALARYFRAHGYRVEGSDSPSSFAIPDALKREGFLVKIGYKAKNVPVDAAFVVYHRAIPLDHPELVAARKLSIPTVPYATVLGTLTENLRTITITGSHGKSTTTALAGLMLAHGGLDPTVLVGTNLREFGGKNIRVGKDGGVKNPGWLVLEADDFGAAFLAYSPLISIVTNIDREHMDFYKTFARVKNSFLEFLARTRDGGTLILNRDDAPLYSLRGKIAALAKKKNLGVIWYSTRNGATAVKIKKILKLPGEHNLSNATAVYELGRLLKLNEKKILVSLEAYNGAWRRMEYRGTFVLKKKAAQKRMAPIPVYDDYAHHPTEIKATLEGFREKFAKSKIICIFQPHQAKRLQLLFKEFVGAFNDADALVLVPFYKVAGRDEKPSQYTSERLAHAITKKYPRKAVYYLANLGHIKKMLNELIVETIAPQPAVIVMMGAGDIVNYTERLLK